MAGLAEEKESAWKLIIKEKYYKMRITSGESVVLNGFLCPATCHIGVFPALQITLNILNFLPSLPCLPRLLKAVASNTKQLGDELSQSLLKMPESKGKKKKHSTSRVTLVKKRTKGFTVKATEWYFETTDREKPSYAGCSALRQNSNSLWPSWLQSSAGNRKGSMP